MALLKGQKQKRNYHTTENRPAKIVDAFWNKKRLVIIIGLLLAINPFFITLSAKAGVDIYDTFYVPNARSVDPQVLPAGKKSVVNVNIEINKKDKNKYEFHTSKRNVSSEHWSDGVRDATWVFEPNKAETVYSYSGSFWGKLKPTGGGPGGGGEMNLIPYSVSVAGHVEGALGIEPGTATVPFGASQTYKAKEGDTTVTADSWSISDDSTATISSGGTAELSSSADPDEDATPYTVTAEKDNEEATAEFIPTAVQSLSGGGKTAKNDETKTIKQQVCRPVTFNASATAGGFPGDKPTWSVVSGVVKNEENPAARTVVFKNPSENEKPNASVQAKCGPRDDGERLNVIAWKWCQEDGKVRYSLVGGIPKNKIQKRLEILWDRVAPDKDELSKTVKEKMKDAYESVGPDKDLTWEFPVIGEVGLKREEVDAWVDDNIDKLVKAMNTKLESFSDKIDDRLQTYAGTIINKLEDVSPKYQLRSTYGYKSFSRNPGNPGWGELTINGIGDTSYSGSVEIKLNVSLGIALGVDLNIPVTVRGGFEASLEAATANTTKFPPNNEPTLHVRHQPKLIYDVNAFGGGGAGVTATVTGGIGGAILLPQNDVKKLKADGEDDKPLPCE